MTRKRNTMLALFTIALGAATLAFAVLPATNVDPSTVPLGTLAGRTPVNVLSSTRSPEQSIRRTGPMRFSSTSSWARISQLVGIPIQGPTSSLSERDRQYSWTRTAA